MLVEFEVPTFRRALRTLIGRVTLLSERAHHQREPLPVEAFEGDHLLSVASCALGTLPAFRAMR
jgi:hypothetical protein